MSDADRARELLGYCAPGDDFALRALTHAVLALGAPEEEATEAVAAWLDRQDPQALEAAALDLAAETGIGGTEAVLRTLADRLRRA